jgi:AraC family transcriptional regulator
VECREQINQVIAFIEKNLCSGITLDILGDTAGLYTLGLGTKQFSKTGKYLVMPAVQWEKEREIPIELVMKTIPPARYAKFTHSGFINEIGRVYEYIFGTWIPSTKHPVFDEFEFEYYDKEKYGGPDDPEAETDIYIPLEIVKEI